MSKQKESSTRRLLITLMEGIVLSGILRSLNSLPVGDPIADEAIANIKAKIASMNMYEANENKLILVVQSALDLESKKALSAACEHVYGTPNKG